MALSFRAISCLACQTVLRPRSRLVDFNKFYYNVKVTRGGHEFRHESTGTGHKGTGFRYARDIHSVRLLLHFFNNRQFLTNLNVNVMSTIICSLLNFNNTPVNCFHNSREGGQRIRH